MTLKIGVISLFPEFFDPLLRYGVVGRAIERGLAELKIWDPREYTYDPHRTVDDSPYGGGPGMVMKAAPLREAILAAKQYLVQQHIGQAHDNVHVVYLTPQGQRLDQAGIADLVERGTLVLIAGRYEGIDERIIQHDVDAEYSIGDYVLSGGEIPALVLIDAMVRTLPGVLGNDASLHRDTFQEALLACPQYTRPACIDGQSVPEVLMSGDHGAIARWRKKEALGRTWLRRPDLLEGKELSLDERALLDEYKAQYHAGHAGQ